MQIPAVAALCSKAAILKPDSPAKIEELEELFIIFLFFFPVLRVSMQQPLHIKLHNKQG